MNDMKNMKIEELYCYYRLCVIMKSKYDKNVKPSEYNRLITIEHMLLEEINNKLKSLINV